MNIKLLNAMFDEFGKLAGVIGNSDLQKDIAEFSTLFNGHENLAVLAFSKKLHEGKIEKAENSTSLVISRLQTCLRQYSDTLTKPEGLLTKAKIKAVSVNVEKLISALNGCPHSSIREFVEDAKIWLAKPSPTARRSPPPLRIDVVRSYSDELSATSEDNAAFDHVVARLKSDKNVRLQEMREIANIYLDYEGTKKSKVKTLQMITDRHALDARQNATGRMIMNKKTG